jgi:hypothetical protein
VARPPPTAGGIREASDLHSGDETPYNPKYPKAARTTEEIGETARRAEELIRRRELERRGIVSLSDYRTRKAARTETERRD